LRLAVTSRALGRAAQEAEWVSLVLIGGLLSGYAMFSKGFAYLGRPPFFVGELVLAACLAMFAIRPNGLLLRSSRVAWLIGAFWFLCLLETVPYLGTYGLNTLRDSVIYGYSLFAIIVGTLMARQDRMRALLPAFEIASYAVIILSPFVIMALRPLPLGTTHVPLIYQKAGDLSVHLVGAAVFRLVLPANVSVIRSAGLKQFLDIAFWSGWLFCAAWVVSISRGALVTIGLSLLMVFAMGYARRVILIAGMAFIAVAIILAALHVSVRPSGAREVSTGQIVANTLSIVSGDTLGADSGVDVRTLHSNTQWRLRWWSKILDYTVFGENFWTGRGFGINLATKDGFQTDTRQSLRSPHSIHMTILARTGVPGLIVWLTLLGVMFGALLVQVWRMRALGYPTWQALSVWILIYWMAAIVNGSFDVYLEGPQGGIWAWSLMGLGIAVVEIEKRAGIQPARQTGPTVAVAAA
jgi:hypothetical protein